MWPMEKLITYLDGERGRRARLAETLGISQAALSVWRNIPAEHVLKIETATGISRHDLRPDVFGKEGAVA